MYSTTQNQTSCSAMKAVFTFLFLAAFSYSQAQLSFKETSYDFGNVESGKVVSHRFTFTNVSGKKLGVQTLKTTCKCTESKLESSELLPGLESGVEVSYNSSGQKGAFTNSVQLLVEKMMRPVTFTIRGNVIDKTEEEGVVYKDTLGNLAFDHINDQGATLKTYEDKEFVFKYKNIGSKPITFNKAAEAKECFVVTFSELTVKPGKEGVVTVKFLGAKARDAKFVDGQAISELIVLKSDDPKSNNQHPLAINANYQRVFSAEEMANAPVIEFDTKEYVAGEIIQGQSLKYSFVFKNTGKSPLEIESAKASCGCTATAPQDKIVQPGDKSQIDIQFDSKGKMGPQHKTVTVKSNDPKNSTIVLHFRCTIIEDPFGSGTGAPVSK